MKRYVAETGRQDVFLDAETDERDKNNGDRDDDGEDVGRELKDDERKPDDEV